MNIDDVLDDLGDSVDELARNTLDDHLEEARRDFGDFTEAARGKLSRWAAAVALGHLSKDEFALLLRKCAADAELHALNALGLTQVRLERFRFGMVSLLVSSIFKAIRGSSPRGASTPRRAASKSRSPQARPEPAE